MIIRDMASPAFDLASPLHTCKLLPIMTLFTGGHRALRQSELVCISALHLFSVCVAVVAASSAPNSLEPNHEFKVC